MTLLTIFSAPKPFIDPHISIIQKNAIRNWCILGDIQIILLGDEKGVEEVAEEYKLLHIKNVQLSNKGTPLVSSMFSLARQNSQNPLLMCVNADILFLPDLVKIVLQVYKDNHQFLLIGQRWDLNIGEELIFSAQWEKDLFGLIKKHGRIHLPTGSDYFVFPRDLYQHIPDFTIGRSGWDNWMIYYARNQGWPVIDASGAITAIHQTHDYSHLPNGQPHYNQEESQRNITLAGGLGNLYTILDADKQLDHGKLIHPRFTLLRFLRQAELWCMPKESSLSDKRSEKKISKSRIQIGRAWIARRFRRMRRYLTGSL